MTTPKLCKIITEVPQISLSAGQIYGCAFDFYKFDRNGKIDAFNTINQSAILIPEITIDSTPGDPKHFEDVTWWGGNDFYVYFETEKEALRWKYNKVIKTLAEADKIANRILDKNEKIKQEIGLFEMEQQYPELAL